METDKQKVKEDIETVDYKDDDDVDEDIDDEEFTDDITNDIEDDIQRSDWKDYKEMHL